MPREKSARSSGTARIVLFPEPPRLQRARGSARLGFASRDGDTVLADLYQSGCAKIRLPRSEPDRWREAVLINTAGGLTDGDRLETQVSWSAGSRAAVTSQAAERIYRSRRAPAEISTGLTVESGATALWLPQETILFDRANLARKTEVALEASARLVACESVIFGRAAMGEVVGAGVVRDGWRLRIDGRLEFADCFQLCGDLAELLDRPALGGGARAMATVICAGRDLGDRDLSAQVVAVRALDPGPEPGGLAVSRRGDVTVTRILAGDGLVLRRRLVAVLEDTIRCLVPSLAGQDVLPRVWAC